MSPGQQAGSAALHLFGSVRSYLATLQGRMGQDQQGRDDRDSRSSETRQTAKPMLPTRQHLALAALIAGALYLLYRCIPS